MCWLNGRNNRCCAEEVEVCRIDHLGVFYSPAAVIFAFEVLVIDLKDRTVAAIADGMCTHLEIALGDPVGNGIKMFGIAQQETIMAGLVAIWLQKTGASGTKGSIAVYFESADVKAIRFNNACFVEIIEITFVVAQHYINAHFQQSCILE